MIQNIARVLLVKKLTELDSRSLEDEYYMGRCDCSDREIVCKRLSKFASWWSKAWLTVLILFYLPLFLLAFPIAIFILGFSVLSTEQIIVCQNCNNKSLRITDIVSRHLTSRN